MHLSKERVPRRKRRHQQQTTHTPRFQGIPTCRSRRTVIPDQPNRQICQSQVRLSGGGRLKPPKLPVNPADPDNTQTNQTNSQHPEDTNKRQPSKPLGQSPTKCPKDASAADPLPRPAPMNRGIAGGHGDVNSAFQIDDTAMKNG